MSLVRLTMLDQRLNSVDLLKYSAQCNKLGWGHQGIYQYRQCFLLSENPAIVHRSSEADDCLPCSIAQSVLEQQLAIEQDCVKCGVNTL